MSFVIVCIAALLALGAVAAVASRFQRGDDEVRAAHDCSSCSSVADGSCKLGCMMEEKKQREGNK